MPHSEVYWVARRQQGFRVGGRLACRSLHERDDAQRPSLIAAETGHFSRLPGGEAGARGSSRSMNLCSPAPLLSEGHAVNLREILAKGAVSRTCAPSRGRVAESPRPDPEGETPAFKVQKRGVRRQAPCLGIVLGSGLILPRFRRIGASSRCAADGGIHGVRRTSRIEERGAT